MFRGVVVLAVVCGCSQTPPPRSAATTPPTTAAPASTATPARPGAAPAVTAEAFCSHFEKLTSQCSTMRNARMAPETCVADARTGIANDPQFAAIAACIVQHDDCDAAISCVTNLQIDPTASLRGCNDDAPHSHEQAVGIAKAEWDHRNGTGVTAFRDAKSTKAAPIEMCGVDAATEWLTTLRCNDGSQPFPDHADAEYARAGNVGLGGRCHSIIDHYLVLCPEKRYELFIDAYVCPRPN